MTSEFNAVPVREKYKDFPQSGAGKIKEQMPLLLADARYPMFTTELFEQRLQGRGINRYVDTGDLIAYNGPKSDNQEIKLILTANRNGLTELGRSALNFINPQSKYINGALDLTRAKNAKGEKVANAYDALSGKGIIAVKRKDLGFLDERLTQEQVLSHKGWRILMRHPDEVPKEFAEDFERAKEYIGRVVFSHYNEAMGFYPANGEKVPTLRALYVCGLDVSWRSYADGRDDLDYDYGRLVGVAPEAPNALGSSISQKFSGNKVHSYTLAQAQEYIDILRGVQEGNIGTSKLAEIVDFFER